MWRWQQSPWWVLGIGQGLFFTVVFAIGTALVGGDSFVSTLPMALIAGLVFGALMGPMTARMRRQQFAGVPPEATDDQQRRASKAVSRGPVPTDPMVRALAVHLLRQRLQAAERGRVLQATVFGLFMVLYVVQAVTWSPWWVLGVALFGVFFVLALLEPRRLARRLAVLTK